MTMILMSDVDQVCRKREVEKRANEMLLCFLTKLA